MAGETYKAAEPIFDEEKALNKLTKKELVHLIWSTSGMDDMMPAFLENIKNQDDIKKSITRIYEPCRECNSIRRKLLDTGILVIKIKGGGKHAKKEKDK